PVWGCGRESGRIATTTPHWNDSPRGRVGPWQGDGNARSSPPVSCAGASYLSVRGYPAPDPPASRLVHVPTTRAACAVRATCCTGSHTRAHAPKPAGRRRTGHEKTTARLPDRPPAAGPATDGTRPTASVTPGPGTTSPNPGADGTARPAAATHAHHRACPGSHRRTTGPGRGPHRGCPR